MLIKCATIRGNFFTLHFHFHQEAFEFLFTFCHKVGPKSEIESLDADKITATISATGTAVKTGSVEMPVTFRFDGASSCWAYGKYTANLNISESK